MCDYGCKYVKLADAEEWICRNCFTVRSGAYMAGYNGILGADGATNYIRHVYAPANMAYFMNATAPIYNLIDNGTTATTLHGINREPHANVIITNLRDTYLT